MHFSKTYAQLLLTLPPELRKPAFEYRKLKQLINQTVSELVSLGLGPSILQSLQVERGNPGHALAHLREHDAGSGFTADSETVSGGSHIGHHTVVYEIILNSSVLEPRLRLSSSRYPSGVDPPYSTTQLIYHINLLIPEQSFTHITRALLHPSFVSEDGIQLVDNQIKSDHLPDLIIPLPSDATFFQLLTSTLLSISDHLDTVYDGFRSALTKLVASISSTALPASSSAPDSFLAYSLTTDNATSLRPGLGGQSDLYTWREIFRIYTEAEIFECVKESTRREKSVEEVEEQLKLFEKHIREQKASLIFPGSRQALDVFMTLNLFILDAKKLQLANSEATRKILKKHAKRTAFPIPSHLLERHASTSTPSSHQVALISRPSKSLPRLLVQAIGEVLLPIVPSMDDYSCLICTFVAFKPIRLRCGHFFCVRCLAKLQRRGSPNCPLCRAPTVLQADSSNVDYGLLNFMADWFPIESREKQRVNELEVTREQLERLGIADAHGCRIV